VTAEAIVDCRCEVGEGPIWDDRSGHLLFVDIDAHRVHRYEPSSGAHDTFDCGEYVSAVVLDARGGYLVALQHDLARFDFDAGRLERMVTVDGDRHDLRFNDGCVDRHGRLWCGTLSLKKEAGQAALYRVEMDGGPALQGPRVTRMLTGVTNSNGIDWSPDGRFMYYVDTGTRRVDVFDVDEAAGTIANRRTLISIAERDGKPDGLIVDGEGHLWVALWQGSAVRRYGPDGTLVRQIDLPASCITKCAFGGADLRTLYITSARAALSEADLAREPLAGALFAVNPGVQGRTANRFGSASS
jgi:sugar lactone lactonase YvrE